MSEPMEHTAQDSGARDLLAPLYGEAPALGSEEAAALAATRDLLGDWMQPAAGEALGGKARAAVLAAMEAPEPSARATAVAGTVWVRRAGAREAMPLGGDGGLFRGDAVIAPRGARAVLKLADGSTVMVREESEIVVGAASGAAERLTIVAGRLYAWVAKQFDAAFAVRTPCGFASVVGTEFDLQTDREGNLTLVVTEGQVNFRPSAPNAAELALRRNEMMEHRASTIGKRRISSREAARLTGWANPARRGNASAFALGIVALALLGGGAFWLLNTPPKNPAAASSPGAAMAGTASGGPGAAAAQPAAGTFRLANFDPRGEDSRTRSVTRTAMDGVGDVEHRIVLRTQVPAGGNSLRMFIEEADTKKKADGKSLEGPQNTYVAMKGLGMTMERQPDGSFGNLKSERKDPTGSDPFALLMFLVQMNSLPPDRAGLRPGDTWTVARKGTFDMMPGCTWSVEGEFTFEGFRETDGRKVAVVLSKSVTTIENAVLWKQETPAYTRTILAPKMKTTGSGRTTYDAANSHFIMATQTNETAIDIAMGMTVKGGQSSTVPLTSTVSRADTMLTTEYSAR